MIKDQSEILATILKRMEEDMIVAAQALVAGPSSEPTDGSISPRNRAHISSELFKMSDSLKSHIYWLTYEREEETL